MKFASTFVSALALAGALGVAPALAQDTTHMIGGTAVPADQVEAYQARCDELRSTDADSTGVGSGGQTAGAASVDANSETTENKSLADTQDAGTTANADAAATPGSTVQDGSGAAGNQLAGLEGLTVEMCDEGGFAATAM